MKGSFCGGLVAVRVLSQIWPTDPPGVRLPETFRYRTGYDRVQSPLF
jgi:hypothetical protein